MIEGIEAPGEVTPPSEPNLLDLLRQDITDATKEKEVLIPILGYERTGLSAKYRMPEGGKEIALIQQRVERETKDSYERNLFTATGIMAALCIGLYVQPPNADVPVMLDIEGTNEPVRFDESLATLLGWQDVTATRQIIMKLFGGNEIAILSHMEKLQRWLEDSNADVNRRYWQSGE